MTDARWQRLDGDAELVRAKGETYRNIADAIGRATVTLGAIVDDTSTTARAMDATRTLASDVRDDISKATDRYRATGDALVAYAKVLGPAVSTSQTAADRIASVEADLAEARRVAERARSQVDDLPQDASADDVHAARGTLSSARSRVVDLESDLRYWQGRWDDAKADKDAAAVTARNAIDEVVTGSRVHGLEDGFWDKVGDVWDGVYKVFKIVCDVAGVLSIFLSWVPVLGQVLVVLAAVGAILAVVDAAIRVGRGQAGWGELAWAVGGAALALFGGKAISALAKYAKARMVIRTAETMAPGAARDLFGSGAVIDEAVDTLSSSGGARAWEIVKSPFVRGAEDVARLQAFRANPTLGGFVEQLGSVSKSVFVNPFKDFRLRALTGNQDVIDMVRLARESGTVIDGTTRVVAVAAATGAGLKQLSGLAATGASFADATTGSDRWQMVSDTHGAVTSLLDAPWSDISGGAIEIAEAVFDR